MAILLTYALTTVADVKESLGIPSSDTSKDNLIIRKINYATEVIEKYCQRRFALTTYTDVEYDGTSGSTIVLKQRPIVSLTALGYRNTTYNDSDFTSMEARDYFLDSSAGVIELLSPAYGGWGRYKISYTAGYTNVPADLSEACVTLAAYLVENSASGTAVKKKQEGQRSIEYFDPSSNNSGGSLLEQLGLDDVLAPYKNYSISDTL